MSDRSDLSAAFDRFARVEAPDLESPMYAELAAGVAEDDELLALAARRQQRQPAPNMLFGAVQYLLLQGTEHPLAAHYPIVSGPERPRGPAFPLFRAFCLEHREQVGELIASRRTQTQVVRRCTCLLPVFGLVHREAAAPLALIDVGASAGLNLNFDRYAYRYRRVGNEVLRWGREALKAQSRERPIWRVALEGVHPPSLTLTRYRDGSGDTELLAKASPHGWWIEWGSS